MKNINIQLYQQDIKWLNPQANLKRLSVYCETLSEVDIVILPEMFTTGFTNKVKSINVIKAFDQTLETLTLLANKYNIAIVGSVIYQEENKYYNRFIWVDNKGLKASYDKKHLFTHAGEHKVFSPNNNLKPTIIEYKGWRIAPFICYDLRFPIWMRNSQNIDLAIVVANWPDQRSHAWRSLLIARAIENQYYIAAVNRAGIDPNNLHYTGYSTVIDFKGAKLVELEKETSTKQTLNYQELKTFRTRYAFQKDADYFVLKR